MKSYHVSFPTTMVEKLEICYLNKTGKFTDVWVGIEENNIEQPKSQRRNQKKN